MLEQMLLLLVMTIVFLGVRSSFVGGFFLIKIRGETVKNEEKNVDRIGKRIMFSNFLLFGKTCCIDLSKFPNIFNHRLLKLDSYLSLKLKKK